MIILKHSSKRYTKTYGRMKWKTALGRICMLISLGLFCGFSMSCEDPDRALTRAERKLIDSFYRKELLVLQGKLDTLCMTRHDSIFQSKFDSIIRRREAEHDEIMGKFRAKYLKDEH